MTFYRDLTRYDYFSTDAAWVKSKVLNIGWLDEAQTFEMGEIPLKIVNKLELLCKEPVLRLLGFHFCPFCNPDNPAWGNGEIRVIGTESTIYAAPALIHHYVAEHKYLPPAEFLDAIDSRSVESHLEKMLTWDK